MKKNFKNFRIILAGLMVLAMSVTLLAGCSGTGSSNNGNGVITDKTGNAAITTQSSTTAAETQVQASQTDNGTTQLKVTKTDADGDGIPDTVEKTYGTNPLAADTDGDGVMDKTDTDPVFTPDLIKETATTVLPVKVKDTRVEDNVNASDHLEIALANTGNTALNDFDIYYTVTDTVTKKAEGYYLKLTGFTLEAGATKTIHFDNKQGELHYSANFNGIYGTSKNEVLFQGRIHAIGYAPIEFSTKKAKGTAEVAD